jgi:hypothetical protein
MIPKLGKPLEEATSYRPISLLPIMSKIFEKAMLKRLRPILEKNRILSDYQFGFRKVESRRILNFVSSIRLRRKKGEGKIQHVETCMIRSWKSLQCQYLSQLCWKFPLSELFKEKTWSQSIHPSPTDSPPGETCRSC